MFWYNQIVVENQKTHKRAQINLETGQRKDEMAMGGVTDNWKEGTTSKFKTRKDAEHRLNLMKNNNQSNTTYKNLKIVGTSSSGWAVKFDFQDKMAKGGKVTFEDKVKAIKASLLKKKKVSPKVQKDYGKTYSPKEAEQSAKRIAGSMRKKEMK
jgi:hypothetical protein